MFADAKLGQSLLAFFASFLLSRAGAESRQAHIHVPSDVPVGSIIKKFPVLPGLHLLPSHNSDRFYLLQSGGLMVTRSLTGLAGSNLSLAVAHSADNKTDVSLLGIHVHCEDDFLEFGQPEYIFSVVENSPPDTELGTVYLNGDNRRNLEIILDPPSCHQMFSLVPSYYNQSAALTLVSVASLDREASSEHSFRLVVSNPESLESTSTKVRVFVKNENDNAPEFKKRIYSFTVPVSTPRFKSVGRVYAFDKDGDRLVYSLLHPSPSFVVVPQTGELLLAHAPHLKMYLLEVSAKDTVPPVKKSRQPALVYINFVEEELDLNTTQHSRVKRRVTRAVRPTKRTEFTEGDGEPEGKIVFQLEKESEHETFKIRDENPWVTVEPNGAVRVKKKWDYEELGREKTIDFWVIITNAGSGGRADFYFRFLIFPIPS